MNPTFTIIIPHKDIPDLLMRCLDSIPVSEDIQVIVVDDNSPDADTYLERYPELSRPYLEFIRAPKNGGGGYARNIGLDHAKGKWLLFADADDYFADNMLEILLSKSRSEADIVFFRKKGVLNENTSCESGKDKYLDRIMDTFLKTGDEWPIRMRFYVPWGKMIRRDLVVMNNIRFDEVRFANDCFFSMCAGYFATKIEAVNEVLYIKTCRAGSLTANFLTKPGELQTRADVVFRIDRFLLQHNICRERALTGFLIQMLKTDRALYRMYFNNKLLEVYPSKWDAIKDIREGHSWIARAVITIYSLLIWRKS